MKKILSVLLASLLLLSTSATAFAMETETNADNWLSITDGLVTVTSH